MTHKADWIALAELEKLVAGMTGGEWSEIPQHGAGSMIARQYETDNQVQPRGLRLICHMLERKNSLSEDKANAAGIVAIRNAFPALVARIRELEEGLREIITAADDGDKAESVGDLFAIINSMLGNARALLEDKPNG